MGMKPIVFFDIETTGLSKSEDRIIEIYLTKRDPVTLEEIGDEVHHILDPEVTIGEEAKRLHGITEDDVRGRPKFRDVAEEILAFIKDCDLSGYNILGFDLPFMFEEFYRCGKVFKYTEHKIIDSFMLWKAKEPRTLEGSVERFLGEKMVNAHKAKDDTQYQVRVLEAQMKEYKMTLEEVAVTSGADQLVDLSGKFSRAHVSPLHQDRKGDPIYNFGKYKGLSVFDVHKKDPGYLVWLGNGSSMPSDTKIFARKFLKMAQA